MKVALITGITGQDGSYLSQLLLNKGYKVIGVTRNNHSANLQRIDYLKLTGQVEIIECDLMDMSSVFSMIVKHKPDEVYNLAAQSSVGLSFSQPIGTLQFNIISVLNLLETIRLFKPDVKFYQASSSEMYGKTTELPITINTPMHPLSPYAISKASGYWTVVNYREAYGLFACNGILFNHESFLRGNNFFVKKVISEAVVNRNNPDWILKLGNLDVSRDFGYSVKYVEAMWLMLQQETPKDIIICSGESVKLRTIVEYVFKKLDISLSHYEVDPALFRPSEILDIYGSKDAACKELNWKYDLNFFQVLDLLMEEEINHQNRK